MKRNLFLISLLALTLFAVSCATAPVNPSLKGVVSKIDGNTLTVTPRDGGQPSTVNVVWGTQVYWENGLEAGKSVLTVGHPVHVYLSNGTQNAAKIVIAN